MLAQLNLFCHGYVATPIIEACRQHGLFKLLDTHTFQKRKWLIKKLKANTGYFTVALQALESLGWLEKNTDDAYRLTSQADPNLEIGDTQAGRDYLKQLIDSNESGKLAELWLKGSKIDWQTLHM